jgi:hypothetical protein
MEKLSESPWASKAKEHWKKYRPKMYAALVASGKLNYHLKQAVERTKDQYCRAIEDGMEPHEAWEAVRESYLFLPSEEDQPSLGEDPNPEPEPTPVGEIPAHENTRRPKKLSISLLGRSVYSPRLWRSSETCPRHPSSFTRVAVSHETLAAGQRNQTASLLPHGILLSRFLGALYSQCMRSEPKPCRRFRKMRITARFSLT